MIEKVKNLLCGIDEFSDIDLTAEELIAVVEDYRAEQRQMFNR